MDDEYLYIPTPNQQKMISLLVIPPSILSFIGSSLIIYFVRNDKKKTLGRRILLALSVCDIISTTVWLSQPYFMASDAINSYVWTFGNDATCTVLGFFTQFTITSHLYSAALSIYFLLSIRFGVREATFAKKYERWMHVVFILFGLGTAITGVVKGMFHVSHIGPGCWVSHPPEGDVCANDSCGAEKMAWIFAGIPTLLVLVCIAASNVVLYCYVRATVMQGQKRALENEERLSIYSKDESQIFRNDSTKKNASSGKSVTSTRRRSVLQSSDKRWKRVRDLGTQSFLYVGAYLLCFVWSMAKQVLDGQGFDQIPGSGAYFLPLLVLQSIFLPAQGLFNAVIFFRPKYNQSRTKYPNETHVWSMKRAIFGATIKPLNCAGELVSTTSRPGIPQIPRNTVSSLIASDGDFDHVPEEDEEDKRWGGSSSHDHQQCLPMHPSASCKSSLVDGLGSSLEVMSDISTSVIESMNALSEVGDEHGRHTPMDSDHSKSRWRSQRSSNSAQMNVAVSISPTLTKRIDSDFESLDANLSSSVLEEDEEDKRWGGSSSHDHQQCLPMRPSASCKSSLVDGLGSSLEVISEISTSVIESMNALSEVGDEHGRHTPMDSDHSKSRWRSQRSSNSAQMNVAVSISPTLPKRIDSDFESLDASNNSEILAPSHKLSPHTSVLRASSEVSMQSSSQKLMDTPISPKEQ